MSKHCFDSKCLELAEYFYPHAAREWLSNLAQQFQDVAESAEDIDDKTLPIPDFLRNQDNLRAERAEKETSVAEELRRDRERLCAPETPAVPDVCTHPVSQTVTTAVRGVWFCRQCGAELDERESV